MNIINAWFPTPEEWKIHIENAKRYYIPEYNIEFELSVRNRYD